MLPSIALVHSVEMIRDGGSLGAAFQGSNGSEYWLFLKLKVRELPSGERERIGYEEPVIVDKLISSSIKVSWQQAGVILNQMRPMLRDESSRSWLETMYESVQTNGQLPSGVERILPRPFVLGG